MTRALRLLLGVALLVALATPAAADRDTAVFFTKRGEKALGSKDGAAAAEQFQRALAEDATYLPARTGLGEALLLQKRQADAAAEFRAVVEAAEKLKPVPAAFGAAVAQARKRLAEVDVAGNALARVQRKFVDDLVALADRWKAKDPRTAEQALRRALAVLPDHPDAARRLEALGKSAKGWEPLFDGKVFDDWTPREGNKDGWSIADGVLRGGQAQRSLAVHTSRWFGPDLDVRMEARVVETLGDSPKLGIVAASTENERSIVYGFFVDAVILDNEQGDGNRQRVWSQLLRNVKPAFEPTQWTMYELRLRGDDVSMVVNGTLLRSDRRPKDRRDGRLGVLVQDARVEVRRFDVVRR